MIPQSRPTKRYEYGTFDFNKTPLAPLRTKALIYDYPASRASWAPHATDGFYVGPVPDHYRCLSFCIPATQRFRFSDTWRKYPMHSQIPMTLQHDLSIVAAADLLEALGTTVPTSATAKRKYIRAIQDLTAIMAEQQTSQPPIDSPDTRMEAASQRVGHATPPRVATRLNNITAPNVIRQMPLVHQRHTRNNSSFQILSTDGDEDDDTAVASNCSPRLPPPSLPSSNNPRTPPARPRTRQVTTQPTSPPSTLQLSCLPEAPSPRVLIIPSYITASTPTAPHVHIHDLQPTPSGTHSKPPTIAYCPAHALPIVEPDDERDEVPTKRAATPPTPLHPNHDCKSNPMQHFTPSIVSCHWAGIH